MGRRVHADLAPADQVTFNDDLRYPQAAGRRTRWLHGGPDLKPRREALVERRAQEDVLAWLIDVKRSPDQIRDVGISHGRAWQK
eukprot:9418228-Pyramimonas_sp.AAC.1